MLIGIISDTHDNVINIKKAVELFKKHNVDFVIHAGDVVAPATVRYFEGLKMKFIFGNCDGDRAMIEDRVKEIGGEHHGRIMELKVAGKTIGAVHGDDHIIWDKMTKKGYDFLIHGHTHIPEEKKIGKTMILCPGGHYLGDEKDRNKVMILDLQKGRADFLDVR